MPASEPKSSEPKKLPGIFISYRRSDNPDAVGRIYDRLVSEFGKARVFKDVDSIPLGQDFRGHLNEIVGGCAAVLAIIGPKWIDTRNAAGQRRLEDADDFVRIELEAALARDVPVVPVLVGHAAVPGAAELPPSLASMVYRQSIEVRPDPDFHNDATRLVSALWAIVDPNAPRAKVVSTADPRSSTGRWLWPAAFAAVALAAIALAFPVAKHLRETPPAEVRIAVPIPIREFILSFAVSPDGRQLVYMATDDPQGRLWLRTLSTATAQPLAGTEGGSAPFWSPDGHSIGFFAAGSLKRLDLGSGKPQSLAGAIGETAGAWGAGGDIVFNPRSTGSPVRVAATGGPATEITRLEVQSPGGPVLGFLPDGKHFLYAALGTNEKSGTYLAAVDGSTAIRLTSDVGPAAYLPSGWLLLMIGETASPSGSVLVAQRLDLRNARLTGERLTLASGVRAFSASATGLVAYQSTRITSQRQLTWVGRSGTELGKVGDADGTLSAPRVAPDGRRVVVSRVAQENRDLWLLDGARASRLTFDASVDEFPVWSKDGSRITFTSRRSGKYGLYQKLASGGGGEELILAHDQNVHPSGWSADGRFLMYFAVNSDTRLDILALPTTGDRKPLAQLTTPFSELWGHLSPDGRWMAYQSDETGKYEVYVRAFQPVSPGRKDEAAASQWMVSTGGGVHPMWSANGKELYFLSPDGEMMAASIAANGSDLVQGTPAKLFDARIWGGGIDNSTGRQYDVAPDGRFLINRESESDATPTVTLIQNWNPDASK